MMRYRSPILAVLTVLIVLVSFWPAPAHANALGEAIISVGASFLSSLLQIVIDVIDLLRKLMVKIITWGGSIINEIVSTPEVNNGGVPVYTIWKIFRDMCNALFIVLFIFVAFGTIFNVVWKNPFYYQTALTKVILAAVLINFSLPIGQTILWAGNAASTIVVGLMRGSDIDVGAKLLSAGPVIHTVVGDNGPPAFAVPRENTPPGQIDPIALISTTHWQGNAKTAFTNCVKFGQASLAECNNRSYRIQAGETAAAIDQEASRQSDPVTFVKNLLPDAFSFWGSKAKGTAVGATNGFIAGGITGAVIGGAKGAWSTPGIIGNSAEPGKPSPSEQISKILTGLINLFFLGVMAMSFLVVVIVLLVRFPVLWFYLAMSSIAFFFIAIPGSKRSQEWFGNIFGWSIFAPLYLFVIYIGMVMLEQSAALLDGMKGSGFFSGIAGVALFYFMVGGIFIGGAAAAWKYAFSFSSSLKSVVGFIGDKIGVDEKSNFGFSTVARRTGMTARYEGAKAAIAGRYEKTFVAPQKRREEDIKAKWQARFGDDKAEETLKRTRIGEQIKANKELGLSTSDLIGALEKPGTIEYFAAGKELLDRGEMPIDKMQEYVARATKIGPSYGAAAQEAVNKQLRGQAKEKSFENSGEALAAFNATAPDGQKKFLQELKKNQLLEYASLASNPDTRALIMTLEGSSGPVLPADILKQNMSKIDADSIGKIMAAAKTNGWAVDSELNYRFDDLAGEKGNQFKLIDGAKGPARTEVVNRLKKLKEDQLKGDLDKAKKIAEAGAEANAEALVTAQERLEATRDDRSRTVASRRSP